MRLHVKYKFCIQVVRHRNFQFIQVFEERTQFTAEVI